MSKDYYLKYIKYKNKYIQLSNKLGGAAAEESPKKRSKPTITVGDIFYVKWNMSDGTSRYYESSVIAINKAKKTFTLRYSLPEEDGSHVTEIRKNSEIDKDSVLRRSTYLENFSEYPPKKARVGEEFQATIPSFGTPTTQNEMQPLTEEQILKQAEKDIASLPPHIQTELQVLARERQRLAAEILLNLKNS